MRNAGASFRHEILAWFIDALTGLANFRMKNIDGVVFNPGFETLSHFCICSLLLCYLCAFCTFLAVQVSLYVISAPLSMTPACTHSKLCGFRYHVASSFTSTRNATYQHSSIHRLFPRPSERGFWGETGDRESGARAERER